MVTRRLTIIAVAAFLVFTLVVLPYNLNPQTMSLVAAVAMADSDGGMKDLSSVSESEEEGLVSDWGDSSKK